MIGGYMTFQGIDGKASYRETAVAEALPVVMEPGDDRREMPQGVQPAVRDADHPIAADLPAEWPALLGYNRFAPKPDATVVATVGADPLIVAGRFGSGRSVAFASIAARIGPRHPSSSGRATPSSGAKSPRGSRETEMVALNIMRWGRHDAAKTMVALHGITANGGAMTEPARLLAERGWQVLAPDMRGHGESGRGDGDFSFASLLGDLTENVPAEPDLLLGHSFGGTLAQLAVLGGILRPKALLLEDPVSHFADKATPKAMLDWDEANLPRDIGGLRQLNPGWSSRDAAWKLVSLEQFASTMRAPPSAATRPGICATAPPSWR